jgi:hypothetical protein
MVGLPLVFVAVAIASAGLPASLTDTATPGIVVTGVATDSMFTLQGHLPNGTALWSHDFTFGSDPGPVVITPSIQLVRGSAIVSLEVTFQPDTAVDFSLYVSSMALQRADSVAAVFDFPDHTGFSIAGAADQTDFFLRNAAAVVNATTYWFGNWNDASAHRYLQVENLTYVPTPPNSYSAVAISWQQQHLPANGKALRAPPRPGSTCLRRRSRRLFL